MFFKFWFINTQCILPWTGQIVGVILLGNAASSQSDSLVDVTFTSRSSVRWLAETEASANATEDGVVLVRLTLAWVTGLILLISTLLGVRFIILKFSTFHCKKATLIFFFFVEAHSTLSFVIPCRSISF